MGINVLSLFDGMSCAMIALERAGIEVDNYYASEIDKYAIQVSKNNYPDIQHIGDVTQINAKDLPRIDLLVGGSPCQGFSFAGKQLNFSDSRSKLFFEYTRILNEIREINPDVQFLLENVKMKKEYQDVISLYTGVQPIFINSNLVSAQNRQRLYWTNIPGIDQPEDKGICWGAIREYGVADKFYYSENGLAWIGRHSARKNKKLAIWNDNEKCQMIEASHFKNYSSQRFFGINDEQGLRYITPVECERAQTIPDNYTFCVSNTQRYKMLGNGWNVDTIVHIFKNITTANQIRKTA